MIITRTVDRAMPVSSDAARQIEAMRDQGFGFRTIARTLNERHIPTASGVGQWYPASARAAVTPGYWAEYQRQRRQRHA